MHCGEVKDCKFLEGRKVSVNKSELVLKLTNQKWLADGSVIEKLEVFDSKGLERDILKDGQKIGAIIPRLNRVNDNQNWLSI